ncbi:MAG: hypothetical protein RIC36_16515 [Rhodospirillales bacterium]
MVNKLVPEQRDVLLQYSLMDEVFFVADDSEKCSRFLMVGRFQSLNPVIDPLQHAGNPGDKGFMSVRRVVAGGKAVSFQADDPAPEDLKPQADRISLFRSGLQNQLIQGPDQPLMLVLDLGNTPETAATLDDIKIGLLTQGLMLNIEDADEGQSQHTIDNGTPKRRPSGKGRQHQSETSSFLSCHIRKAFSR